jgi:F0F1-type ATP synthase membrane subunit b/b'
MDEQNVLKHLLEVEGSASSLVIDAQAEADRRVTENEVACRARHDERFAREAADLEAQYTRALAAVKADYDRELALYRESLDALPLNRDDFSRLVRTCMVKDR